jgi:EAL domain-containing protein (putative c-di-GMP-specific phosphodiesterase class I)
MTAIAEGVETQEQAEYLKEVGCDVFQGFHYSRPITVEEFERQYL